jgi:hypothetical protein
MSCARRRISDRETGGMDTDGVDAFPFRMRTPLWRRAMPSLAGAGIVSFLFFHLDVRLCPAALPFAVVSRFIPALPGVIRERTHTIHM